MQVFFQMSHNIKFLNTIIRDDVIKTTALSYSLLKTNRSLCFCVNGELDFAFLWPGEGKEETLKRRGQIWKGGGVGRKKGRMKRGEHILWAEPNLARHPVGAILPKAQRGRYSAHYFVHFLIVNPAAGRGNTHH